MADASARGWGYPDAADYRARNITTITVAGIRLAVHRSVAHLFAGFIRELVDLGYDVDDVADDWGYANRCIRGTGPGTSRRCVKSNHSWGLAVDINATANPMTSDGRNHTNLPPAVSALAARWGMRWGGDYTGSRRDPMHFEFMGSPDDVGRYPLGQKASSTVIKPASGPSARVLATHTYEEDGVPFKTELVEVPHRGFGLGVAKWNAGLGRDPVVVAATIHGPSPDDEQGTDKWWDHTIGATVRAQPRAGHVVVTVTAPKNTAGLPVHVWVTVR